MNIWFKLSPLLFPIMGLINYFLLRVSLYQNSSGREVITLATISTIIYFLFLIVITCKSLRSVFNVWEKRQSWKWKIFFTYALSTTNILLGTVLISMSNVASKTYHFNSPNSLNQFDYWSMGFTYFIDDFFWSFFIGVPITLYGIYLGIKALIQAKKINLGYSFGILLLAINVVLPVLLISLGGLLIFTFIAGLPT